MSAVCEVVTNHVVFSGPEIDQHIVVTCEREAIAVVDDDGDDVTVCLEHLPVNAVIVARV